ncbi:MAG: phosphoglycolate phosphatase [Magnetococcales bacterium]|nr:phosphoglycolate phosphatase [Magnetococcales bacterium]
MTTTKLPCRTLLFDLDGTLVDSAPDLWHTMNHVMGKLGLETLALDQVRNFVGNGARFLLARGIYGEHATAPDDNPDFEAAVKLFLDYYQEHMTDHSRPYAGCMEILQKLKDSGFKLAVVTNKTEKMAKTMLSNLSMDHFFAEIVGGDTLEERKPHPLPLLYTLKKLDTPPSFGVMVGDSETDCKAARSAKCGLILVSHGYNRGIAVNTLNPDATIDFFEELPPLLELTS